MLIQYATEINVRAERRCRELLRDSERNAGSRGGGSNQHEVQSHDSTAPTLADIGRTRDQSSLYQQLAAHRASVTTGVRQADMHPTTREEVAALTGKQRAVAQCAGCCRSWVLHSCGVTA